MANSSNDSLDLITGKKIKKLSQEKEILDNHYGSIGSTHLSDSNIKAKNEQLNKEQDKGICSRCDIF